MSVRPENYRSVGRVTPDRIKQIDVPRLAPDLAEELRSYDDLSGLVADTLDALGLSPAIGVSRLKPTIVGSKIVGTAITLRNVAQPVHDFHATAASYQNARIGGNKLAEIEAHNLAQPGDILVIQGVEGASNMGGMSAQIGKRQGEIGAVVVGGVRDIGHMRALNYPVWSTDVTPLTGKWRIETTEINGPIEIFGCRVEPGDLVVADETGVCFVPRARLEEALAIVRKKAASESARVARIDSGVPVPEL